MSRTGKVGRLPADVRQVLNVRLQENVPQEEIVEWLNELPEVKSALVEHFEGRPISQQNVSDWKLGGYKDWVRDEHRRERADRLLESSDGLAEAAKGSDLADRLACVFTAELAGLAEELMDLSEDPKERWKELKYLLHELAPLRRQNHRAVYARIAQSKQDRQEVLWEREDEEYDDKEQEKYVKERQEEIMKPWEARKEWELRSKLYNQDPDIQAEAAFMLEVKYLLEPGTIGRTKEEWDAREREVLAGKENSKVQVPSSSEAPNSNESSPSTGIVCDYKGDDEGEKKKELIRKIAAEIRRRLGPCRTGHHEEEEMDDVGEEGNSKFQDPSSTEASNTNHGGVEKGESGKVGQGESETVEGDKIKSMSKIKNKKGKQAGAPEQDEGDGNGV